MKKYLQYESYFRLYKNIIDKLESVEARSLMLLNNFYVNLYIKYVAV